MTVDLHLGDCFDFLRGLPDGSVDAVVKAGRNFIGCEIDTGYYEIAKRRIDEARAAVSLFAPTGTA